MYTLFFNDPTNQKVERELNSAKVEYYCFNDKLKLKAKQNQVACGCLLAGNASLLHQGFINDLNQFDFFFIPPKDEILIQLKEIPRNNGKICLCSYPIENEVKVEFELKHYDPSEFEPRGELGSNTKMATYRTVWTAITNGYFMAGFTNIPKNMLTQGVITSVNLEETDHSEKFIYPHIHPEFPECYIFCIDDETYAITQYLINSKGESVSKDLTDGEGLFFPGSLGHSNFARPTNKQLNYCQYLWIIPTFGRAKSIAPITLKA